jgi:hypothetical protein
MSNSIRQRELDTVVDFELSRGGAAKIDGKGGLDWLMSSSTAAVINPSWAAEMRTGRAELGVDAGSGIDEVV